VAARESILIKERDAALAQVRTRGRGEKRRRR
jgi:hypothetical protein